MVRTVIGTWDYHQSNVIEMLRGLSAEQMALPPAPGQWAIWQLASHMAGARAYWFHDVLGEWEAAERDRFRVAQTTVPGLDLADAGWEDDEDHPRSSAEVVEALEATRELLKTTVLGWTEEQLAQGHPGLERHETRAWVVAHLVEHDAHHAGEISSILGANGLPGLNI